MADLQIVSKATAYQTPSIQCTQVDREGRGMTIAYIWLMFPFLQPLVFLYLLLVAVFGPFSSGIGFSALRSDLIDLESRLAHKAF